MAQIRQKPLKSDPHTALQEKTTRSTVRNRLCRASCANSAHYIAWFSLPTAPYHHTQDRRGQSTASNTQTDPCMQTALPNPDSDQNWQSARHFILKPPCDFTHSKMNTSSCDCPTLISNAISRQTNHSFLRVFRFGTRLKVCVTWRRRQTWVSARIGVDRSVCTVCFLFIRLNGEKFQALMDGYGYKSCEADGEREPESPWSHHPDPTGDTNGERSKYPKSKLFPVSFQKNNLQTENLFVSTRQV